MTNLEIRLPGHQLDFRPPYRADQYESPLWTRETHATAEPEQPRFAHDGTRLFQYLSAKSLLPALIALGAAPRPSPSLTIIADQYDAAVGGHTEGIRSVGRTLGDRDRRVPGGQPITSVRAHLELFTIACDPTLKH